MGTYYSEKYGKESASPENDNLTAPQKIKEIHREYIEAGADILRTNSCGLSMKMSRHPAGSHSQRQNRNRAVQKKKDGK